MDESICVIVGAGPGNGAAFARRFAKTGKRVALLARDAKRLDLLAGEVPGSVAIACDVTDLASIERAFARVAEIGPVGTLIFNAGNFALGTARDTTAATLESSFRINCTGCLCSVQGVLPGMLARGSGSIVIIGATASRRGSAGMLPFAAAKSAQRVMAESMARELGSLGIHVAYVVIDGVIDTAETRAFFTDKPTEFFLQADDIADTIFQVSQQSRSAWTFELDLRPYAERW